MGVVDIIAAVVALVGGLSLSCGGWSALSLGARSLFVATQFISSFGMCVRISMRCLYEMEGEFC